jgi:uncharacterized repeat protein (TIGR01451 family)
MPEGAAMKYSIQLLMICGSLLGADMAIGQETGNLQVRTVVQKEQVVVGDDGQQRSELMPAAEVVPGDEVVYTITFENISDESVQNVVVTNPIAAELTYVDRSAFGPGTQIEFSVDGGQSYAPAEELTVTENGTARPALPEDFTNIRWSMANELVAGAQGLARFRARLD